MCGFRSRAAQFRLQVRSSVPERGQVDEQKFKAGKGLTLKRREHVRKGLRIRFFEHRHEGKGGLPSRAFLPLRAELLFGCPVPEQPGLVSAGQHPGAVGK